MTDTGWSDPLPGHGRQPGSGTSPGYGPIPGWGAAPPGHGQQPEYGAPPGYGPPPWAAPPGTWSRGPGRPAVATTAAVLGFVTGGLTALASLFFLIELLAGADDGVTSVLAAFGAPCAALSIAGAARLLEGHPAGLLSAGAVGSVATLALALLVGIAVLDSPSLLALGVFVILALPLPVLTGVFARMPTTRRWSG